LCGCRKIASALATQRNVVLRDCRRATLDAGIPIPSLVKRRGYHCLSEMVILDQNEFRRRYDMIKLISTRAWKWRV